MEIVSSKQQPKTPQHSISHKSIIPVNSNSSLFPWERDPVRKMARKGFTETLKLVFEEAKSFLVANNSLINNTTTTNSNNIDTNAAESDAISMNTELAVSENIPTSNPSLTVLNNQTTTTSINQKSSSSISDHQRQDSLKIETSNVLNSQTIASPLTSTTLASPLTSSAGTPIPSSAVEASALWTSHLLIPSFVLGIDLDGAEKFAADMEDEMFRAFSEVNSIGNLECGKKYKEKYRSLQFNLKDKHNHKLRIKILQNELAPNVLPLLSPEELANEEFLVLKEEARKQSIRDAVLRKDPLDSNRVIQKTHKGEVEIFINSNDSEVQRPPPVLDLKDTRVNSIPKKIETLDDILAKMGDVPLKKGKDDAYEEEYRNLQGSEYHQQTDEYEVGFGDDVWDQVGGSFGGGGSFGDDEGDDFDDMCRQYIKEDENGGDDKVFEQPPLSPSLPPLQFNPSSLLLDQTAMQIGVGGLSSVNQDDKLLLNYQLLESSNTMIPPLHFQQQLIPPGIDQRATYQPPQQQQTSTVSEKKKEPKKETIKKIWSGKLSMAQVGKYQGHAKQISGPSIPPSKWEDILPCALTIDGRIPPKSVLEYLSQQQHSQTKEIVCIEFKYSNLEESTGYRKLFDYFHSRKRYAVIGHHYVSVKDMYVVPLGRKEALPAFFEWAVDVKVPVKRDRDMLLGVIVLMKDVVAGVKRKVVEGVKEGGGSGKRVVKEGGWMPVPQPVLPVGGTGLEFSGNSGVLGDGLLELLGQMNSNI